MIKLHKFEFNPFHENTYVVWDDVSKDAMIIDPGCNTDAEEKELGNFILQNDLKIKYLINTHSHIDHILGNNFVLQKYSPQFLIPEEDKNLFLNAKLQAERFRVNYKSVTIPNDFLSENISLRLGEAKIKTLFTPGHTTGEFCIYFPDEKFCITGDVLFKESIGRVDLEGGNFEQLIESIKNKLLTLPDDTVIYPGHGDSTTILYEKNHNPFLV
jgi:glyoxylase-like metal-dependent hydrolase (beta-lactamase superfamily II)